MTAPSPHAKPELKVTAFIDYICPFCYIGDLRLERLRDSYDLKVNWCFIEIHPDNPPEGRPVAELGYPPEQWRQMMTNLDAMAREEGIELAQRRFTTNSHQALMLAEAAKAAGPDVFYRLHRRLFEAYFVEGRNIGDEAELRALAAEAGMDEAAVTRAWENQDIEARLRQNLAVAWEMGVGGTPTFFIGPRRLAGAVSLEYLREAAAAQAG